MEMEQQYQNHRRPLRHEDQNRQCRNSHQERSTVSPFVASNMVQSLNNRACVMVAIGEFTKANHLLEIALTKHRELTALMSSNGMKHPPESTTTMTDCIDNNNNCDDDDFAMMDSYHDDSYRSDYDTSESSYGDDVFDDCFDDDGDLVFRMGDGGNASDRDRRKENGAISPSDVVAPSATMSGDDNRGSGFRSDPAAGAARTGIRRLTTCSKVRTFSYSGQWTDRCPGEWAHHRIYSMPIVMDEIEWRNAPMNDRTFVLIFNSALSNHLLGMQRLQRQQQQQQRRSKYFRNRTNKREIDPSAGDHEGPFETAKMLYKLGLEVFSGAPSTFIGVDRLCYPAVFNNLSHACKVLEGYGSRDARVYDAYLLKSIYWLIDSRNPAGPNQQQQQPPQAAATAPSGGSAAAPTRSTDGHPQQQHLAEGGDSYEDADAEIVDAFLENVFYLIGERPSDAPAAAA